MIFVDDMHAPFRSKNVGGRIMLMSHLFSDASVAELEEFAHKLGLNPKWIQNSNGFVHYDVSSSKRIHAIALGATPITYRDLPKYVNKNIT